MKAVLREKPAIDSVSGKCGSQWICRLPMCRQCNGGTMPWTGRVSLYASRAQRDHAERYRLSRRREIVTPGASGIERSIDS